MQCIYTWLCTHRHAHISQRAVVRYFSSILIIKGQNISFIKCAPIHCPNSPGVLRAGHLTSDQNPRKTVAFWRKCWTTEYRFRASHPHLKSGRPALQGLSAQFPAYLLDHDAVHAHGLETSRVVEHVRPAQGHGQHQAGEVFFVGKQVQEDRQYHKHSLDETVQETQETRALLLSSRQRHSTPKP